MMSRKIIFNHSLRHRASLRCLSRFISCFISCFIFSALLAGCAQSPLQSYISTLPEDSNSAGIYLIKDEQGLYRGLSQTLMVDGTEGVLCPGSLPTRLAPNLGANIRWRRKTCDGAESALETKYRNKIVSEFSRLIEISPSVKNLFNTLGGNKFRVDFC